MIKQKNSIVKIVAFPAFIAVMIAVGIIFRQQFVDAFRNREAVRALITTWGGLGPLVFIALQILQVVVFIIPGEVIQISGGFIFGFWAGAALSIIGIGLGSMINYYVGRILGKPFVSSVVKPVQFEKFEALLGNRKTITGYLLLFLIPGIPKDVLCYFAGMGKFSAVSFLFASMIARLPGIVGSTLIGSATYSANYTIVIGVSAVAVAALIAGVIWRSKLEAWINSKLHIDGKGGEK
jgi:uncharacterized membrane protein YdjX (TVP38/TMEM64 family)